MRSLLSQVVQVPANLHQGPKIRYVHYNIMTQRRRPLSHHQPASQIAGPRHARTPITRCFCLTPNASLSNETGVIESAQTGSSCDMEAEYGLNSALFIFFLSKHSLSIPRVPPLEGIKMMREGKLPHCGPICRFWIWGVFMYGSVQDRGLPASVHANIYNTIFSCQHFCVCSRY
jgi:hypothetical protein